MKYISGALDIIAVPSVPLILWFIYGIISEAILSARGSRTFHLKKYINIHSKSDIIIFAISMVGFIHAICGMIRLIFN